MSLRVHNHDVQAPDDNILTDSISHSLGVFFAASVLPATHGSHEARLGDFCGRGGVNGGPAVERRAPDTAFQSSSPQGVMVSIMCK